VGLGRERRRKRREKGRRDGGTNEGESVVLELALLLEVFERRVPLCAWDDVGHAVVLCIRRIGGERRSREGEPDQQGELSSEFFYRPRLLELTETQIGLRTQLGKPLEIPRLASSSWAAADLRPRSPAA
jgi:hypothetical protein